MDMAGCHTVASLTIPLLWLVACRFLCGSRTYLSGPNEHRSVQVLKSSHFSAQLRKDRPQSPTLSQAPLRWRRDVRPMHLLSVSIGRKSAGLPITWSRKRVAYEDRISTPCTVVISSRLWRPEGGLLEDLMRMNSFGIAQKDLVAQKSFLGQDSDLPFHSPDVA